MSVLASKIIPIIRSKPFDPAEFIRDGWTIEEQDERSLTLTEIDLTTIHLESMLKEGEKSIGGEDRLTRLKVAGHVLLDARIFQTFWENQHLIPECFKELTNRSTTFIMFDGTILRDRGGTRNILCLWWDGKWRWGYEWMGFGWHFNLLSAVL